MSVENPTFNQLKDQLDSGHRDNMTMLVEGEDGKIITASFAGKKQAEGDMFQVEVTTADGGKEFQYVSSADMSDERQAELAEALGSAREASAEHNEALSTDAVEALGHDAIDAVGIEQPGEEQDTSKERVSAVDKLTRIVEAELQDSASVAERTVNELSGENSLQYFHEARDNALSVLDSAVRRAMNGEAIPVTAELAETVNVLRQASNQLELGVSGDAINERADVVRKSSYHVDEVAQEFFAEANPHEENERAELISRARVVQVEISSLLHENVTHYVDRIAGDERKISDLLFGISSKFAYTHQLDQENTSGLYNDIQELIGLTGTSRQARDKLRQDLVSVSDYTQQLRDLAGRLVHI